MRKLLVAFSLVLATFVVPVPPASAGACDAAPVQWFETNTFGVTGGVYGGGISILADPSKPAVIDHPTLCSDLSVCELGNCVRETVVADSDQLATDQASGTTYLSASICAFDGCVSASACIEGAPPPNACQDPSQTVENAVQTATQAVNQAMPKPGSIIASVPQVIASLSCDTTSPDNGADSVWYDVAANRGQWTILQPSSRLDADVYFFDAACDAIEMYDCRTWGLGMREDCVIPATASYAVVDGNAGTGAYSLWMQSAAPAFGRLGELRSGNPVQSIAWNTAACTPSWPTNGIDGQWFKIEGRGDRLIGQTFAGVLFNYQVALFDANCNLARIPCSPNEVFTGTCVVPSFAVYALVDGLQGFGIYSIDMWWA